MFRIFPDDITIFLEIKLNTLKNQNLWMTWVGCNFCNLPTPPKWFSCHSRIGFYFEKKQKLKTVSMQSYSSEVTSPLQYIWLIPVSTYVTHMVLGHTCSTSTYFCINFITNTNIINSCVYSVVRSESLCTTVLPMTVWQIENISKYLNIGSTVL